MKNSEFSEDGFLHSHHRENLKSHMKNSVYSFAHIIKIHMGFRGKRDWSKRTFRL
jgi:hypothetical protein